MSFQYSKFLFEINNIYKISFFGARRGPDPFVLSLTITNNTTRSNLVDHAEHILKTPYVQLTDLYIVKNMYADHFSSFNKNFDFKIKTELSLSWVSMTYHLANESGTTINAVIEPNQKTPNMYTLSAELIQKQKKNLKKTFTAPDFHSFFREVGLLLHNIDNSFDLEALSWLII